MKTTQMMIVATVVLSLALTAACDQGPDLDAEGGNAITNSVDPYGNPTCAVDFPCRLHEDRHCVGPATYRMTETRPCEDYCNGEVCSGAACEAVGPVLSCPVGQVCIRDWAHGHHCAPAESGPQWVELQQVGEGISPRTR